MYDKDWYIGAIEEVCDEEGDVNFMHPKVITCIRKDQEALNILFWPSTKDICFIPKNDIICTVSIPTPSSKSARKYKISSTNEKMISESIIKNSLAIQ